MEEKKIKRLYRTNEEWQTTLPGTEEYKKLGKEILTINLKNLFYIGTVRLVPRPVVIKNNLKNTPGQGGVWTVIYGFFQPHMAEQWFFKK